MKELIAQYERLIAERNALLAQLEAQIEETQETAKQREARP